MKLRKALVAAATALTVSTAGTVVADAQTTNLSSTSSAADNSADSNNEEDGGDDNADFSSDLKSLSSTDDEADAGKIKNWIGVFTAVIGALSAAFAFITRYLV